MRNKIFKVIPAIVSLVVLGSYSMSSAGAITKIFTVDNDTNVGSYSNSHDGRDTSTWGSYKTDNSTARNGDLRLRQTSTKSTYDWYWGKEIETKNPVFWSAYVYLSDKRFTDTKANYKIFSQYNNFVSLCSFDINQDTAPYGYYHTDLLDGVATYELGDGAVSNGITPKYMSIQNSGISGKQTGADEIRVKFTYFPFK